MASGMKKNEVERTCVAKLSIIQDVVKVVDAIYYKTRDGNSSEGLDADVDELQNILQKPTNFGLEKCKLRAI